MDEHILIPKNVTKSFNMHTFFQINNTLEERRVRIGTSDNVLEITLYGDIMYEDKEALSIFGLLYCGEHVINYNTNSHKLYLCTKLNVLKVEVQDILDILHKCYLVIRERKRLTLTSILDRISYEVNVKPMPDNHSIKEVANHCYSLDRRAPDID